MCVISVKEEAVLVREVKTIILNSSYDIKDCCKGLLQITMGVCKIYDVIIPYTHNTAHVMILPLEIIIIIHYTICLTYNTFNNPLLREGYCTFKVLFIL